MTRPSASNKQNIFSAAPGERRQWRTSAILSTWLPVLVGIAVIARESTEAFSSSFTTLVLRPIWEKIFGPTSDFHWEEIHHVIRKTGHFVGYGLLGVVWLRAWLRTRRGSYVANELRRWRLHSTALALACTALIASADEIHQTFLPDRTGRFADVVLDTSGATAMILILAIFFRWWRSRIDSR